MKADWASKAAAQFEVGIGFSGIDDVGLVNAVTSVISADMRVDMRAISFETRDGIFEGQARVVVSDTEHLSEFDHQALGCAWRVHRGAIAGGDIDHHS